MPLLREVRYPPGHHKIKSGPGLLILADIYMSSVKRASAKGRTDLASHYLLSYYAIMDQHHALPAPRTPSPQESPESHESPSPL